MGAAISVTVFYEACDLIQSECESSAEETDPVCVDLLISVWTGSGNSRSAAGHTHTQKDTHSVVVTSLNATLEPIGTLSLK